MATESPARSPVDTGTAAAPFWQRWGRLFAIAVVVVVALLLFRYQADIVFLLLAGLLFAESLNGCARWIERTTKLSYKAGVAILTLLSVAATVGGSIAIGAKIVAQVRELVDRLPQIVEQARHGLSQIPLAANAANAANHASSQDLAPSASSAIGGAGGAMLALSHGAAAIVVVFFVGLYGALDPKAYPRIALTLVPKLRRARYAAILGDIDESLKRWMLGRVVAIASVGVITSIGLSIVGVPLALGLGVIAGVATFVEYVGAVASAIPAILLALTKSPSAALWTLAIFTVAHIVEGYVLTPLLTKSMVRLAPAYTLATQALLGSIFGVIGVTFATPLMVIGTIFVRKLYVEDVLHDSSSDRERHDVRTAFGSQPKHPLQRGETMNWDQIAGDWQNFKGKVRQKWAKLTDSDVESIGGKKDQLLGALRSRYGYEKDHADRELSSWIDSMKEDRPSRGGVH